MRYIISITFAFVMVIVGYLVIPYGVPTDLTTVYNTSVGKVTSMYQFKYTYIDNLNESDLVSETTLAKNTLLLPLQAKGTGKSVTVLFNHGVGTRNIKEGSTEHKGSDFTGKVNGSADDTCYAIAPITGKVYFQKNNGAAGNTAVIDRGDGYKLRILHMLKLNPNNIADGTKIPAGTVLGTQAGSGYNTEQYGRHIHLDVMVGGNFVNPWNLQPIRSGLPGSYDYTTKLTSVVRVVVDDSILSLTKMAPAGNANKANWPLQKYQVLPNSNGYTPTLDLME